MYVDEAEAGNDDVGDNSYVDTDADVDEADEEDNEDAE